MKNCVEVKQNIKFLESPISNKTKPQKNSRSFWIYWRWKWISILLTTLVLYIFLYILCKEKCTTHQPLTRYFKYMLWAAGVLPKHLSPMMMTSTTARTMMMMLLMMMMTTTTTTTTTMMMMMMMIESVNSFQSEWYLLIGIMRYKALGLEKNPPRVLWSGLMVTANSSHPVCNSSFPGLV